MGRFTKDGVDYFTLECHLEDNVKLVNATNPDIETIRRSIIPTQLCQVKGNAGYAADFGVFEIGRVVDGVDPATNLCNEQKKLAVTLFSKTKGMEQLYMELRDMLAVIADDIKHDSLSFAKREAVHSYQHLRNLNAISCGGKTIGEIGIVHPVISKKIDKKANIVYAEIDVKTFAEIADLGIAYDEPSKYPDMEIDLTFMSDRFAPIGEVIKAADSPLIKDVSVVDTYTDANGKAITVRILFSDKERTLTTEEVMAQSNAIIEALEAKGISLKK